MIFYYLSALSHPVLSHSRAEWSLNKYIRLVGIQWKYNIVNSYHHCRCLSSSYLSQLSPNSVLVLFLLLCLFLSKVPYLRENLQNLSFYVCLISYNMMNSRSHFIISIHISLIWVKLEFWCYDGILCHRKQNNTG